jgi:hypothetical protein
LPAPPFWKTLFSLCLDYDNGLSHGKIVGDGEVDCRHVAFRGQFGEARRRAANGEDVTAWLTAWRELGALVRDADALYLDPKQSALAALSLARDAARKETA